MITQSLHSVVPKRKLSSRPCSSPYDLLTTKARLEDSDYIDNIAAIGTLCKFCGVFSVIPDFLNFSINFPFPIILSLSNA